jgi:hypothetical protein
LFVPTFPLNDDREIVLGGKQRLELGAIVSELELEHLTSEHGIKVGLVS